MDYRAMKLWSAVAAITSSKWSGVWDIISHPIGKEYKNIKHRSQKKRRLNRRRGR